MATDPGRTPLPAALPTASPAPALTAARNQRMPVDGGLAGLGLVTLAAAAAGIVLAIALFVAGRTFGYGGPSGGILPSLFIFAASLVRSAFHVGAGRAATKRLPLLAEATTRYLVAAGAHTALILAIVAFVWLDGVRGSTMPLLIGLGVVLMAWPVTLWTLVRRRAVKAVFKTADTFDVGLVPGDRSVGGAGVLMTAFGALFLVIDLAAFAAMIVTEVPIDTGTLPWFVLLFLFTARSSLHLGWGLAALRGKMDFVSFRRVTQVYLWLAFATALVALGAMFAMEEFRIAFRKAPINIIYVAVVIVSALMAWPVVLRAFVQDTVPYWDAPADAERPFRPAVDRGLTALGFLLVWLAVQGLAQWFLLILGVSAVAGVPLPGATGGAGGSAALIVSLATLGLQLWAGLELVGMTVRRQLAALCYGLGAVAALALEHLVFYRHDASAGADAPNALATLVTAVDIATSLLVPLLTVALSRARPPGDR